MARDKRRGIGFAPHAPDQSGRPTGPSPGQLSKPAVNQPTATANRRSRSQPRRSHTDTTTFADTRKPIGLVASRQVMSTKERLSAQVSSVDHETFALVPVALCDGPDNPPKTQAALPPGQPAGAEFSSLVMESLELTKDLIRSIAGRR